MIVLLLTFAALAALAGSAVVMCALAWDLWRTT